MKVEIKTEELIYDDAAEISKYEDVVVKDEILEEKDFTESFPVKIKTELEYEEKAPEKAQHLGEVIWLKSEPTDVEFDIEKEPELDDHTSFGYFEEHGEEGKLYKGILQENSKFACFYCGNESFCLKKLRAHIKTMHTGPKRISDQSKIYEAIIIYSCRYCEYRTNDNSLYSNHLRKHLADLPATKKVGSYKDFWAYKHQLRIRNRFRCPYCIFKTSENERIRQHMCSCHENQRPYHYLKERSISRDEVERKQVIHYPCSECDYSANRSGTLKRHIMAKHTNERPYHCLFCNYQATQNETLRRHILAKHTNEKPHQCPRCPYSAVQTGTLKYHIKSKHNILI